MMATIVKRRCACIGSSIKVLPQSPFLENYSPNRHAILRYRPDKSETDVVIRAFVHSSIEKAFWDLESPHFTFDANFETDSVGLPLKVKISFTRSGVSYDVEVYFMRSIIPGSAQPVKRIDTISDILESASRTFHLFWKYQPKASANDISAWRHFYHSPSAKTALTKDLSAYFGVDMRSASTFRISRKNAARIHNNQDENEKHLVVALNAIKFSAAHLSLVFDFGYRIKSACYLSNSKAADIACILKEKILDIKSARSDFTSGEISDIIQCVQLRPDFNYGRSIGAFLVYSKVLELSNRATPCTKASRWLLSNGSIHYDGDKGGDEKRDVALTLQNHVEYIEESNLFCATDYFKMCQTLHQVKSRLLGNGIADEISYVTLSSWIMEDYSRHLHLSFETSFVFILSNEIFTLFSEEWPAFTAVRLVTAGEPANKTLVSMAGAIKNVLIIGLDTEPISTLGLKLQWIESSLEMSKVKKASITIQTSLPYWRTDTPLRWCLIPPSSSRNQTTVTTEAIRYIEEEVSTLRMATFEEMDQILKTVFYRPVFVVADHASTNEYCKSISETQTPPPKISERRVLKMSDNASSMMSVDWEISKHSSGEIPSSSTSSSETFQMKEFVDLHRRNFKTVSELTHRNTDECSIFLICFTEKEYHKFYLEEIERILMLNVSSITIVVPNIPETEKLKSCLKAETHIVAAACKSLVNHIAPGV